MNVYEQVIEEMVKHGVVIKVNEIVDENYITCERKYVGCVVELDFSEHDKVFEDKIAELEKRIQELYIIGAIRIDEKRELKQRIAELENENKNLNIRIFQNEEYGDKKLQKINLNDRVKVKLTPLGAEIYYHQYDELNKQIKENGGTQLEPIMPEIDKDGFTEFQLHHFISLYGEHIGMCKPNVINPLDVIVVE